MDEKMNELVKKGTTTLGLVTKEGIVLAADKRATMGYLIAHKGVQKIFEVNDKIAMTTAGMVGDNQMLLRYLKSSMQGYELKRNMKPSVKACSTLLSHILYNNRFSPWPFYVQILLAGTDDEGFHLYSLDPGASLIKDKYISTGSGSVVAYGVLQDKFKEDMDLKQATSLAIRAIKAAIERDIGTGEGVDVVQITKSGLTFLTPEEIKSFA